jgi:Rap1 Myb domain
LPDVLQSLLTYSKANGGEVVPLEKQADILIADHARKDIPPGSISWKFIERSVANGKLENIDDHRAGPPAGTIREVGSAQPPKKGRTPFTAEDDRILMEWCIRAERKGLSLKGNELYKQLEAKVRLLGCYAECSI